MTATMSEREKLLEKTYASSFSSSCSSPISSSETSSSCSSQELSLQTSASTNLDSTTNSFHTPSSIPTSASSVASSPEKKVKKLGKENRKKNSDDDHKGQYRKIQKNTVTLDLAREEEEEEEEEEEQQNKRNLLLIYFLTWYRALISRHLLACNQHACQHEKELRRCEQNKHICGLVEQVDVHGNATNNTFNDKQKEYTDSRESTTVTKQNITNSDNKQIAQTSESRSKKTSSLLTNKDIVDEIDKLSPALQKMVIDIIKSCCLTDEQKNSTSRREERVNQEKQVNVQQKEENATRELKKQVVHLQSHKHSTKTHFPRTYAVLNEIGLQSLSPCKAIKHELISLLSSLLNNAKTIEINSFTALEEEQEELQHAKCKHYKTEQRKEEVKISAKDGINNKEMSDHLRKRALLIPVPELLIGPNTNDLNKEKMHNNFSDEGVSNEANNAESSAAFYLTRNPSHTPVLTPNEVHERRAHTLEKNNEKMTARHQFHKSTETSNECNSEQEMCADADLANKVLSLIKTTSGAGNGGGGVVMHDDTTTFIQSDKMENNSTNVDSYNVARPRSRVIPSPMVSTDDSEIGEGMTRQEPHHEHFLISESDEYERKHKTPAYWHVVLQKYSQEANNFLGNQECANAHGQHLFKSAKPKKHVLCPESEELVTSSEDTAKSHHNKYNEHRNPHRRKHHRHKTCKEKNGYTDNDNHTMADNVLPEDAISSNNKNNEANNDIEKVAQSSPEVEIINHNILLPSNRHDNVNQKSRQAGNRLHNRAISPRESGSAMPYYVYDGKRYHSIMPMRRHNIYDQLHGKKRAMSSSILSELAWRRGRNRDFSPRQERTMPLRLGRYNPYCSVCRAKFHYMIMPHSPVTTTPQQRCTLKELEKCGSDYFLCENCRLNGADIFATDLVATCCATNREHNHNNSTNANTRMTDTDDDNNENTSNTCNAFETKKEESNIYLQETSNSDNIKEDHQTEGNINKEMYNTEIAMLRRECKRLCHELQRHKGKLYREEEELHDTQIVTLNLLD